jgi:2-polyprenyl-6-hydroxyphenyl methylase/3-demethylubiquinone-9 3-methyltransferase
MDDISVWGNTVPRRWLSQSEADYLSSLPQSIPPVEWVWAEMDRIWHHYRLDNVQPLSGQPIGDYYSDPVWLMNGIFTSIDPVSVSHRTAIARYLAQIGAKFIADYGGGMGKLAQEITQSISDASVSIVEPYPSKVGIKQFSREPRITFRLDLLPEGYDAIVAQDVLEHIEDPLRLASDIAIAVRDGGTILFANCFFPVIQCHLPSTFHLRHTFRWVMKALGLHYVGTVENAEHTQIFKRSGHITLSRARRAEAISRLIGPVINEAGAFFSFIKRLIGRK